jgi:hypothetical protein
VSGLASLALVALLALPATALADTSGPIAQTGGMTATLPLLGHPLTVAVTLDGVGNISSVDLDPVGDFSATRLGPHAVSFATADGSTRVKIKARGDRMSVKASTGSLDDLLGFGTWTADLFGTDEMTDVAYTIGAADDGTPTLSIDGVTAPADVTVNQKPVQTRSGHHGSSAWARIAFARDGFTKRLTVMVSVWDKGDRPASLTFELSGKDRQKLTDTLENLVGAHAWTGTTCDGPATVNFMVNPDGTVSFTDATPPATAKETKHGFRARFDGTHAKVTVRLWENKDGTWTLKVEGRRDRCKDTPADEPTTNAPEAADAVHSDHQSDSGHWGHRDGDRHGGGSHDGGRRGGSNGGKHGSGSH